MKVKRRMSHSRERDAPNHAEYKASRTAEFMALFRALESCRSPSTRLFNDPYAYSFLRPSLKCVVQLARVPLVGAVVPWFIDRRWPGARSSGVARTRLIDDYLSASIHDGIDQVVILGSGFDCRAYRAVDTAYVRVFEVDHPITLSLKKERLQRILGALPASVTYIGMDFNRQSLRRVMRDSGLAFKRRAFFIWEGVTNYLTEHAVDVVLRYVGSETAPGSRIVFTYVHKGLLDGSAVFEGTRHLWKTLQRAQEPWLFGIYPDHLHACLAARGLDLRENLGASAYRARYMGPSALQMKGYEFYRVAYAHVRARC